MTTLTGKTIGKYTLNERLGSGGMAEVYKAHHPRLDRTVAVKILHGYLAEGEDFLTRFEREARAVASLRHAHIVQIHDFDADEGTYYMVMEFISGGTLQDRMNELARKGKFMPLSEVLAIMKQVAAALEYAHKKGIIHRDIKPSNILIDDDGEAFLTDFGIARMVSTTQFTSTGALIGTPTYMSPEQSKGEELSPASDIYSLGIILFELLTGQAPFTADTPLAVIHKHVNEPLPLPGSLRPGMPHSVEAVVAKALEKDGSRRYQGAGEMAQALEQALAGEDIVAIDKEQSKARSTLAARPTEKMSETELPVKTPPPTVAMGKQTRAEITRQPEPVEPVPSEPEKTSPQPAPVEKKQRREQEKKKPAGPPLVERLKSKTVLYAIAALVVVGVILVIVFTSGGAKCGSIEACMILRVELQNRGDLEGALSATNRAIGMVVPDGHRDFAWIWCERSSLLEQMGRIDEANESRNICAAWERGE